MSRKTLKSTAMGPPKTFPDAPGTFQNRSRAALGKHLAARRHPRAPKRRPRSRQGAAQSAQERPKSAQEPPKRRPGDVQTWQKSAPERSRTSFSCALSRKPCPGSCWADFCLFFASRAGWPTCSDVRFVPLLPVFYRGRSIRAILAPEHAKPRQNLEK